MDVCGQKHFGLIDRGFLYTESWIARYMLNDRFFDPMRRIVSPKSVKWSSVHLRFSPVHVFQMKQAKSGRCLDVKNVFVVAKNYIDSTYLYNGLGSYFARKTNFKCCFFSALTRFQMFIDENRIKYSIFFQWQ